jgi:hypothetical protein
MNLLTPKKMRSGRIALSALMLVCFCIFGSCSKKNNTGPDPGNLAESGLTGVVVDLNGIPVPDATIKVENHETVTAANGIFKIKDIQLSNKRYVITCSKTGYFTQQRALVPADAGASRVQFTLHTKEITHTLNAQNGGAAALNDGSKVDIPAGGLVDTDGKNYTGTVQMAVVHLDPSDPDFPLRIPGGDLKALREDASEVMLYSYGMLQVEMEGSNGEKLQLKTGKLSTLTFAIPQEQLATAPATIPLWYFDEAAGIWKEEGVATKQGNRYVGTVKHFSSWNVDAPKPFAKVKGCIFEPCGSLRGMANMLISVGQTTAMTDANGNFTATVPSDIPYTIKVDRKHNGGIGGVSQAMPALPKEGSTTQNISLPCSPYVTGRLNTCAGQPMVGFVTMFIDGVNIGSTFTDENANFKLFAPKGKTVVLKAFDMLSHYSETTVEMPDNDNGKEIPSIKLCDTKVLEETSFIINGAGYNNKLWVMSGEGKPTVTSGFYDIGEDETVCVITHNNNTLSIKFQGGTTGTYDEDVDLIFIINNVAYASEEGAKVVITKYEDVGGIIEGTFTGTLKEVTGNKTFTLTNGKFAVLRTQL